MTPTATRFRLTSLGLVLGLLLPWAGFAATGRVGVVLALLLVAALIALRWSRLLAAVLTATGVVVSYGFLLLVDSVV